MKYNVVITGSTGMVGKGVLLECLDHKWVEKVLVVNRSSLNLTHPKLRELLVSDFMDLKNIEDDLKGYDACFFSLGVSSIGISKGDYEKITYELTIHFAKTFLDRNKDSTKFSDIEQKGINEAYRMGGNDFDTASTMWGGEEWLETMQQYR